MVTISEGAFAKVNLTLDVLGKREDGYHNIKSIMQTISLHDDVTVDIGTGRFSDLLNLSLSDLGNLVLVGNT